MFKTIFRKLKADKRTTIINIAGFAISMAVAVILLAFVISENSYNKSYTNYKDIYRVVKPYHTKSTVEEALNENLTDQFSQIETSCRFDVSNAYAYRGDEKFEASIADIDHGFF
ncbi:MAG: hypothetical protein MI922_29985, partial [Bacteroidales bacterium]|nr:hypothetical protein [Bacteroidales bacterium]